MFSPQPQLSKHIAESISNQFLQVFLTSEQRQSCRSISCESWTACLNFQRHGADACAEILLQTPVQVNGKKWTKNKRRRRRGYIQDSERDEIENSWVHNKSFHFLSLKNRGSGERGDSLAAPGGPGETRIWAALLFVNYFYSQLWNIETNPIWLPNSKTKLYVCKLNSAHNQNLRNHYLN